MFGKFTQRAQQVLFLAQEEAKAMGSPIVGTEHLLLGLLKEQEGIAARVLTALNVEVDKIRSIVEHLVEKGKQQGTGEVTLTPRGKRVLELSVDEARRMGHNYVGTEHMLLGLVREGEGIAAQILNSYGLGHDVLRQHILQAMGGPGAGQPQEQGKGHTCPMKGNDTVTLDKFGRDLHL